MGVSSLDRRAVVAAHSPPMFQAGTPPGYRGSPGRLATASPPRSSGSGSSEALDQSNNTLTFPASNEDNISVVVRVRPLNDKEIKAGDEEVVQFPGNGQLLLEGGSVGQRPRLFSYHAVFGPGASQSDVLHFSGVERLLQLAVEGFSCTVFCYGQTGSGKTHTLTGPPGLFNGRPNPTNPDHGLVFSSFVVLFQLLSERQDTHFVLKASFLEIYNEKVIDLLNPGSARKPLAVRWTKKSRGFFVENLFTVDCEQLDDLLAVLEEGMRNRSVGAHSMNDHSSRSHTILTVHITSEQQMSEDGVFITKQGKINFVDLAGSEMTKKTHSEGKTLEEANNINKSLMVLGSCIASLSDAKKKSGHIPYRDSKLTKLLADSLAGAGVTLMIACVSPARSNYTETLNTLRYAARAKRIRTKPVIVMDPREALILTLKREVNALQSENEHLRMALQLGGPVSDPGSRRGSLDLGRRRSLSGPARSGILPWPEDLGPPPAAGDTSRLAELAPEDLAKMAEHFLQENEALRRENSELFSTRESLLRDQELVCRENERLLRKLEDVNSVCCRSPIIPARPTYSADRMQNQPGELSQADVWTNPLAQNDTSVVAGPRFKQEIINDRTTLSKPPHRLPDSIQKELDKRRIGFNKSMTNLADAPGDTGGQGNMLLRHASWESPFIETGAEEAPAVRSVKKKLRETQARKDATGAKAAHDAAGRPEVDFQSPSPTARPNNPFGSLLSLREEQRLGY